MQQSSLCEVLETRFRGTNEPLASDKHFGPPDIKNELIFLPSYDFSERNLVNLYYQTKLQIAASNKRFILNLNLRRPDLQVNQESIAASSHSNIPESFM